MSPQESAAVAGVREQRFKHGTSASTDALTPGEEQVDYQSRHQSEKQQAAGVTEQSSRHGMMTTPMNRQELKQKQAGDPDRPQPDKQQIPQVKEQISQEDSVASPQQQGQGHHQPGDADRPQSDKQQVAQCKEKISQKGSMASPEQQGLGHEQPGDPDRPQSDKQQVAQMKENISQLGLVALPEQQNLASEQDSSLVRVSPPPALHLDTPSALSAQHSVWSPQPVSADVNISGSNNPVFFGPASGNTITFIQMPGKRSKTPRVRMRTHVKRLKTEDSDVTKAVWRLLTTLLRTHGQSYVIELFEDLLLSCHGNLEEAQEGSVTFVVRIGSRKGLDKLWTMYNTGELDKRLTKILITDELTTEDKSDLVIQATIPETDYNEACIFFQELENPQQKGGSGTRRKTRAQHTHPVQGSSSTTLHSTDSAHGAGNKYEGTCHLTWPELRAFVADRQRLSREERNLAKEEWDFNDRPTYYTSNRNLQGFIAYHLKKHDQALGFFHDVLGKDENNINALRNVVFIHTKLYEIDKRDFYRKKLKLVLERLSYEELARAYTDKAHAIRFFDKRRFQYMKFIERAVTIGRKCHQGPQTAEWVFDYALAVYKRDIKLLYLRKLANEGPPVSEQSECYSDERIKEGFLKASRYFLEVAHTSTSKDYQALSWVFLGILVNQDSEHRSLSMAFPEEPHLHLTADQCYERGLAIHPDHEIVIRRVGTEYVKLGRFDEARYLLDKSLSILPSQFVYRQRALMFLAMYETANEEDKRGEQARQWLLEAARDFNQALKLKELHADFSDLGYVYFLLGDTTRALSKFQQAATSEQDDYSDQVLTHKRWAKCLERKDQLKGSHRQQEEARKIRKKILEMPIKEDQLDYVSNDFENYSTEEKLGFVRILLNYHFWAAYPRKRTSELKPTDYMALSPRRTRLRYDFFVWHAERDSLWAMAFVHKLESEHGLLGCIQRRDFEVGRKISSEIMRCLRESYRFVIILTPEPRMESLDRVIRQAEMEGDRSERGGEYVVPIKLRECPVPDMLKPLTVLECKEGQILREHWDKLVLKLIQDP